MTQSGDSFKSHPTVYWTQSEDELILRIESILDEDIYVDIKGYDRLEFSGTRIDPCGFRWQHSFSLDLFSVIEPNHEGEILEGDFFITLRKQNSQFWPAIVKNPHLYNWLEPVDDIRRYSKFLPDTLENSVRKDQYWEEPFEYDYESGGRDYRQNNVYTNGNDSLRPSLREIGQDEINTKVEPILKRNSSLDDIIRDLINNYDEHDNYRDIKTIESLISKTGKSADIFNPFKRKKKNMKHVNKPVEINHGNSSRQVSDYQRTYLFLYNIIMFIGYMFVTSVLLIKSLSQTISDDTIETICSIMKLLTTIQYMESIHPLLGLVSGGPLMPFAQTTGRFIVVLFLSEPKIRLESEPFVLYLMLVWSAIEIVRYPLYAMSLFQASPAILRWLRYTLFIPLYPMGGFCEQMVLNKSYNFFSTTGQYSLSLPNRYNFSFYLSTTILIYKVFFLWPAVYSLSMYMWSQRKKRLMSSKDKDI